MNLVTDSDGSLRITGLDRLSAGNCAEFKELVKPRLTRECRLVELDCSAVRFIDSDGMGTLVWLHKQLAWQDGIIRLSQPMPMVRQLLRLLHFDELFELTP